MVSVKFTPLRPHLDICVSGVITHVCQKARPRRVDSLDSADNIDLEEFLRLKAQ